MSQAARRSEPMRMADLSRSTGVPVATIKYYMREGLLPPGTPTASNQAVYGDAHVHRLRLIRVLIEVGGLGIAAVKRVIEALEDRSLPLHDLLGVAHHALGRRTEGGGGDDLERARAETDAFLDRIGWSVSRTAPARADLAGTLAALRRLGWDVDATIFEPYADAASSLAAREVRALDPASGRAAAVERMVVGTVVLETALLALRRLCQEHNSAVAFSAPRR